MRKWVLGIVMVALAGCSSVKESTLLRLNIPGEPATMDPRKGGDIVSSCMQFMLFQGLTTLNPDSTIGLGQAASIDISADRMTYTFFIRNDANWSNGAPVTSYDFEKSWKDILTPGFPSPNTFLLYPIKNAEAAKKGMVSLGEVGIFTPDAKTLAVRLEQPTPYFLQILAFCVLFPVNKENDLAHPNWAQNAGENFVCNGPFRLVKWKHTSEVVFEKNPTFWDAQNVQLEGVHVSMIDNEMTALQMYEKGELDMMGMPFSTIPVDAIKDLTEKNVLHTRSLGAATVAFFNVNQFPFNNVHIRRAFGLALDRGSIVKNVTQLNETIATQMIAPALTHDKHADFYKDADIEEARKELEIGLQELNIDASELSNIVFNYSNVEHYHKIAQAIQQQWNESLGITVKLESQEHKVMMDMASKKAFTVALLFWAAQYDDPMNIFERFKFKENVKNYPGWENKAYQELLTKSAYDETPEERMATLDKAEKVLLDEMPFVPVYHWSFAYMAKPHLKNVLLSSIGDVHIEKIVIEATR